MKISLYVEGGGEGALRVSCKRAFSIFLRKARVPVGKIDVKACGPAEETHKYFAQTVERDMQAFLLVDSDCAMPEPGEDVSPWTVLKRDRPAKASDEQFHLMVQCMENWFLADHQALRDFYENKGKGIFLNSLPKGPIESVADCENCLKSATRESQKGSYHKGRHSFKILETIDPEKVIKSSPWAKRFVETLSAAANGKMER